MTRVKPIEFTADGDVRTAGGVIKSKLFPDPEAVGLEIGKPRDLIETIPDRLDEFYGGNIVELGIHRGGSTAVFADALQPARLMAADIVQDRVAALDAYIEAQGLSSKISCHYGVNQGDRAVLNSLLDDAFGDAPVDLVLDDASHSYHPTRASFEVLFPRLRPGGCYIIEDWKWQHNLANSLANVWEDPSNPGPAGEAPPEGKAVVRAINEQLEPNPDSYAEQLDRLLDKLGPPEDPPRHAFSRLVLELVLLRASTYDLIDDIRIDKYWVEVRRGSEDIDAQAFSVSPAVLDCFGQLSNRRD